MVVWLFAGGGHSEIRGLIPFLVKHFPEYRFERKTPINAKIGPRPGRKATSPSLGKTGRSLGQQIKRQLVVALQGGRCDLILVIDDLDCHDSGEMTEFFLDILNQVDGAEDVPKIIGFAAPELESWLIADWENSFAKDLDFRRYQKAMQWWLSSEKGVPCAAPESFSCYDEDKDSCHEKLSDLIIEASKREEGQPCFSKAAHTPRMLRKIVPETVSGKCPLFGSFFEALQAAGRG